MNPFRQHGRASLWALAIGMVLLLLLVAARWWFADSPRDETAARVPSVQNSESSMTAEPGSEAHIGAMAERAVQDTDDTTASADAISPYETPVGIDPQTAADAATLFVDGDFQSNAELTDIIDRLKSDEAFARAAVDELRREIDPDRLRKLGFVLGEAGVDAALLTSVASEMLYSGNPEQEKSALYVLGRSQVRDPAARDRVAEVLESSSNPDTLVGALNALARPIEAGARPTIEQRARIVQQINTLTQHEEASVRSLSYDLLFRWNAAASAEVMPNLVRGLSDDSPGVRRNVVFGFMQTRIDSPEMREGLLQRAEDSSESTQTRNAAAIKLESLKLDSVQQSRLEAVRATLPR